MKKRTIFLMSFALVALLVVGGTMAWFTSGDEIVNSFTAGTVAIEINENGFEDVTNVNPGDTHEKEVSVVNTGSKRVYVRVELLPKWTLDEGKEFLEGFTETSLEPAEYVDLSGDWVLSGGYYYYKHILNDDDNVETSKLITGVKFDGSTMGNNYQGATFELEVKAEAIQATNGAINDEWEVDPASLGLDVLP